MWVVDFFGKACATHQSRIAAVYVALLIGSTIFVAWPQREPSLWALDSYNSGWQALESNDLATAERKLNIAYAYVPENAETNFALGNLHLARGEPTAAKGYYLATLRLDPSHEGAYNNLGVLALQEKRWDVAANFSKALLQDSRNAKTYYLLAQAHFKGATLKVRTPKLPRRSSSILRRPISTICKTKSKSLAAVGSAIACQNKLTTNGRALKLLGVELMELSRRIVHSALGVERVDVRSSIRSAAQISPQFG